MQTKCSKNLQSKRHPGEDYNCRCWAEPYEPEKYDNKPIIVDVSGLDMFKELNNELKPVDLNNKNFTLYAANNKANTTSDAGYVSDDEFLYAKMWANIKEQEGVVLHPYLDTKGLITIGAGANVDDWNVFKKLNFTINGRSATEAQKWKAYKHMRELSEEKDENGNYIHRNTAAENFASYTNIRISDTEARSLAQHHMTKDLAHLRKEFSDFESFPLPLKEVLLDIQYNTGNLNQHGWPKLYKAIREKNVFGKDGIVEHVNRKDVQKSRNDWTKRMARSIRF